MGSLLPGIPTSTSGVICGVVGIAAAILVVVKSSQPSKLDGIPTVGSSSWLGSWWACLMYLSNAPGVLQEGYEKYKSAPFRVAGLYRWIVVFSSREHVEELRRAPDDTLSLAEAIDDQLHVKYLVGPQVHHNRYHVPILRLQLTRNLNALFPAMIDEITTAFEDVLDLRGNEWKSVSMFRSVERIVCRNINRVFVGLPLCRDSDWIDLNIQYTFDIFKGGAIIGLFPDLLKPVAVRFLTNVDQSKQRATKLLGPIIEERLKSLNEYGNEWADKPNDLLSWLMDEAEGPELTVEALTARILFGNVGGILTSSVSLTQALFYLAANPEYIQPLREEVETVVDKEGWSKAALDKMQKVDSFLKECQRLEGSTSSTSLMRLALKDLTLLDGTFIPKGTLMYTASRCIHRDEAFYDNAHAFKPFRFADLHDEDGEDAKHRFASTATEYLPFGHGRHACPGRFFVANELKTMLAHVVDQFDIKLPENAMRPQTVHLGNALIPDPSAKVMFRRRVD